MFQLVPLLGVECIQEGVGGYAEGSAGDEAQQSPSK